VVAGRTDAGVHARGQVAHVDVDPQAYAALVGRSGRSPAESLVRRLAGVLGSDVVVRSVTVVPAAFDARFSAIGRRYCYRIGDGPHRPDPLCRREVLWVRDLLDVDAMHAAAQPLVGEHDFVAFCRPRPGASTVRTLRRVDVHRASDRTIHVDLEADAFCHNQVRAVVGALLDVGRARRGEGWPGDVLRAGRRDGSVHVAPPHGLTLEEVVYPPDERLADQADRARRHRGTST
jgi:tRNA pseudouridine38-40 synthase